MTTKSNTSSHENHGLSQPNTAPKAPVGRPRLKVGQLGAIKFTHTRTLVTGRAQIRDQNGNKHELNARAESENEVRMLLTRRARAIWDDLPYIGPDTPLRSLAEAWTRDVESRDVSQLKDSSKAAYATRAKTISEQLGDRRLDQLTTPFITRFLEDLSRKSPSAGAIARKTLSGMFEYAVYMGGMRHNPIRDVRRLPQATPTKIDLNVTDVQTLLDLVAGWRGRNPERRGGARPNNRMLMDLIVLGLATSARPAELLGLRIRDVDLDDGNYRLFIRGQIVSPRRSKATWSPHLKGSNQSRRIRIASFAVPTVRRLITEYVKNENELLFCTKHRTPFQPDKYGKLLREFREQNFERLEDAGLSEVALTPYAMRKTAATVVASALGVELAARLLGHSDSATTIRHYVDVRRDVPAAATDALGEAFVGLTPPEPS